MACPDRFYEHAAHANVGLKMINNKRKETMTKTCFQDGWMDGWVGRLMDGRMEGWMDGWLVGWMDG
jgi:hypothetical protein